MCSACGYPAAPGHWTDAGSPTAHDRLRSRMRRARLLQNILPNYGLKAYDGGEIPGIQIMTMTGSQIILRDLDEVWALAEKVSGGPVDPLDPRFAGEE